MPLQKNRRQSRRLQRAMFSLWRKRLSSSRRLNRFLLRKENSNLRTSFVTWRKQVLRHKRIKRQCVCRLRLRDDKCLQKLLWNWKRRVFQTKKLNCHCLRLMSYRDESQQRFFFLQWRAMWGSNAQAGQVSASRAAMIKKVITCLS